MRNLKCPLLYQLISDMLPFIITRDWPRCAGVEPQTSMFCGKPVQSLFLVLSKPQQKISKEGVGDKQKDMLESVQRHLEERMSTRINTAKYTVQVPIC